MICKTLTAHFPVLYKAFKSFSFRLKKIKKKYISKCSTDGRPRFIIDKEFFSTYPDIMEAFLTFIGMYYMLDVDYPTEYAMAFSIIHNYTFGDNCVCKEIHYDFDKVVKSRIARYFIGQAKNKSI